MKPRVSIIIPVYNAEQFLPECISSLREQTLKDLELIFIDDGSTDNSRDLLLKVQKEDPRIQIIAFDVNKGVSAARNAGLRKATGDYIGFCDADDTAETMMFEVLLNACEVHHADVSFCRVFKDKPGCSENVPLGFPDETVFDDTAIRDILIPAMLAQPVDSDKLPISGYTPRNLFKNRLVSDKRFNEDIHYAEDLLFIINCLLSAKAAVCIDRAFYHYRFHPDSTTKKYSAFIPGSLEKSNRLLSELLSANPVCTQRMLIRRRKSAIDIVRNYCAEGTPYGFFQRVVKIREYVSQESTKSLFRNLDLSKMPIRISIKYCLMQKQMAILICLLFSSLFRKRM